MKLVLVVSSLQGGGAERVMTILANAWANRGWSIALVTLSTVELDAYPLNRRIERIGLNLQRISRSKRDALWNNWQRIRALRRTIRRADPDVVLSFMTTTNMLTILACCGTGIPVVVGEHTSLEDAPLEGVWKWIYRGLYRRAASVTTITPRGAAYMELRLGRPVTVIPNPVIAEPTGNASSGVKALMTSVRTKYKLLAMGRLVPLKGFDLLLKAYAIAATGYPDWSLVILGEGQERTSLTNLAIELDIAHRVSLPGFCRFPYDVMRESDAFVLSSRYEGMPMALLEAMASGLPCVSFDCRTGPSELIDHGVNGLLVPSGNVDALAGGLARLFGDAALRSQLGLNARKVAKKYHIDAVSALWDDVLLSATRGQIAGC